MEVYLYTFGRKSLWEEDVLQQNKRLTNLGCKPY